MCVAQHYILLYLNVSIVVTVSYEHVNLSAPVLFLLCKPLRTLSKHCFLMLHMTLCCTFFYPRGQLDLATCHSLIAQPKLQVQFRLYLRLNASASLWN